MKYQFVLSLCAIATSLVNAFEYDIAKCMTAVNSLRSMAPSSYKFDADGFFADLQKHYGNLDIGSLVSQSGSTDTARPFKYMLQMDSTIDDTVRDHVNSILQGLNVKITTPLYETMQGMILESAMEIPKDILVKLPFVNEIESDMVMRSTQVQNVDSRLWALDSLDQSSATPNGKYVFDTTGEGVNIYIMDSGVNDHVENSGRSSTPFVSRALNGDKNDCSGHGTHVAGISAGTNVGIAKKARIFSVRVIGCDESSLNSDIVEGIEWVIKNGQKPAIINMSLGPSKQADGTYPRSNILDAAIKSATDAGIVVIVAAGNDNTDACEGSPAGSPGAITVGAVSTNHQRAWFSNYGSCISLWAGGDNVYSSVAGGTGSEYGTKWGTSQATPAVTGVAALYLEKNPNASPTAVLQALQAASLKNAVGDNLGSPNFLLQSISIPASGSDGANRQLVNLFALPDMSVWDSFNTLSNVVKGVIIAIAVLAFLLIVSCTCFCRRRRNLSKQKKTATMRQMSDEEA